MMNDKLYNVLKWVAITGIPALVVFFETVLPVWNVSAEIISRITTTTGAVGVLLATWLMISNYKYNSTGNSAKADNEEGDK